MDVFGIPLIILLTCSMDPETAVPALVVILTRSLNVNTT